MDKKIFLFGSYDWGDGEWMRGWQEEVIENGINLSCDGLIVNGDNYDSECALCFMEHVMGIDMKVKKRTLK